jgi:hypothetical protein
VIPLDPPVGRVERVPGDAGQGQRGAVHPGRVVVAVGQEGRTAAGDLVQGGGRGGAAGERRHRPAAAEHPGGGRQLLAVRGDRGQVPGPGPVPGQVAPQRLEAALDRVHVGVAEGGDGQPAAQVDDPGVRADEVADLVVAAEPGQLPAAHGGRLGEAGRVGGRPDLPVDEDKLRDAHETGCYWQPRGAAVAFAHD